MTISNELPLSDGPASNGSSASNSSPALNPDLVGSKTRRILRWVGYGLLSLYLVDIIYILFPPEFTNIVWEYQTMGNVAQLVPALLLAILLIFYGETADRARIERQVLRVISWATILFAVFYFLMIPLTGINSLRINRDNNSQISTQVNQQKLQLEATEEQLDQATEEQLASLVPVPDEAGNLPNAPTTPQEAKEQILTRVGEARRAADDQARQARENLKQNLIKNSLKIAAEALVASFALVYIWRLTAWARRLESYGRRTMATESGPSGESKKGPSFGKRRRRKA